MKKGKFIVIEGTDGSGKATQVKLLARRLRRDGRAVELADFPQYGQPSAYFVERYLRGEYGTAKEVGPYRASIFYALDRYEKSFEIRRWLSEGKIVISNRYVSANMGHQAGNIRNPKKRIEFLRWLTNLEYGIFGVPRPDVTILLYVDPAAAQKFVDRKTARAYTGGKKRDMLEADLRHLQNAAAAFRAVAKKYKWTVIDCMRGKDVMTIPEVEKLVYAAVQKVR